jgi:hexosaminidase
VFDDVLCAGNEATYALLEAVLGEVALVFPSLLVHVGGDEVPTDRWSMCPKCRALMQASHVDAPALEAVFLRRVGEMVGRLGRRMAVWDEALTEAGARFPLPPDAVVVAWQSEARGRSAVLADHDVVLAPFDQTYFNFQQAHGDVEPGHKGYLPWSKVRIFDPMPKDIPPAAARHVLGAEGALWTEHVETLEDIETLVMPRMAALAEALWSGTDVPEPDFVARWNRQLPALDAAGVRYFVEPPEVGRRKTVFLDSAWVTMTKSALYPGAVTRFTEDGTLPAAGSAIYEAPFSVHETRTVAASSFLPSGRASPAVRATFAKEPLRPAVPLARPMPGGHYRYVEGEFHAAPDATALTAKAQGTVPSLGLSDVKAAIGPTMRKEQYALSLRAFVRVPTDGIYRFIAKADDGVVVSIDGERTVVDDGEHGPRESDGQIALAAGFHEIAISFFQASGGASLDVFVEGPGLPRQPVQPYVNGSR